MTRRFIQDLSEHESVDEIFLLADKQLRTNRQGGLYLQLRLVDRSGALVAMLWNASERVANAIDAGDYVRAQGTTQVYNGMMQMIATRVEKASLDDVDEKDFVQVNDEQIQHATVRLATLLRGVRNYHLRNLAEVYLVDEAFMERFTSAPAGIKNHHAYRGGLLEHVVNLMEVVTVVAPLYPQLDSDLLLLGAFLHDVGKISELTYERDFGYSDEGQLIGHIVMGVELLTQKIVDAEKLSGEDFPEELALRLKHMIVSHHGEYEYGSPKVPMTLEAIALHCLDNLDAKLHNFHQLLRESPGSDSRWTSYHAAIGRKLYKGNL
ncbi:MAG: HD domain-containing protein [Pirellulales bacterium]